MCLPEETASPRGIWIANTPGFMQIHMMPVEDTGARPDGNCGGYLYGKKGRAGSQRKTAAARTVVHRPSMTPSADWQVWVVLMIRPLAL